MNSLISLLLVEMLTIRTILMVLLILVSTNLTAQGPPSPQGKSHEKSLKVVHKIFRPLTYRGDLDMVERPILYDNGILFTYYSNPQDTVFLAGDFNEWKKIPMKRNSKGIFYHFLTSVLKKGDYTYRFQVNGDWVNDQEQPFYKVDIHNQRVSYFTLPRDIIFSITQSPELLPSRKYRFYLKDAGYRNVSLISRANHWEPGFTPMRLENGYWYTDYNWGSGIITYAYWVDGKKILDPHNLSRTMTDFNLLVNYYDPNSNSNSSSQF